MHTPAHLLQADGQGADNSSANKTPQVRLPPHIDMALAQQLILSTSAKIRRGGVTFQKRPLAGETISGYKEAFYNSGRPKKHFMWTRSPGIKLVCSRPAPSNNHTTPETTS
ncbi:hypothetical protein FHETE_5895 [Fusarium heterosporum]|uniref:Uncharacterized protein n=1 Tax=Fusarium heterosporum TaxID=42747 RepID=A0A8H5TEQ5_FUSHE|nr:hypothetical protein FHETE_5895 [Fusarium heterosporum]